MKIKTIDFNKIGQLLFTWTFLNIIFNMLGLWFAKLLNPQQFSYLESVFVEFVKPLFVQSLLFVFLFVIGELLIKRRKQFTPYFFVFFQLIVFHILFFSNVKFHHGMHFESTFENFGVKYLSMFGQYFVDILYLYVPIDGNFDNGLFVPKNTGTFYMHWIFLNIVYYAVLTFLSSIVAKLLFDNGQQKMKYEKMENVLIDEKL